MKREVTTQEALTELAAAKMKLESMQQLLVLTVPESFKFGKALDYAIKSWPHLMNYLDCPEIYLDNSIAERSIRPYVLSRKNFLFCGSEDGARSTCLLFSLIESAIINDINSEEYLSSIFELAADTTDWTDSEWSELLPWNIKLIKKSDVSTVLIALIGRKIDAYIFIHKIKNLKLLQVDRIYIIRSRGVPKKLECMIN